MLGLDTIRLIPLEPAIAVEAGELEELHGDPADRIIIATARHFSAPLLTADRAILAYGAAGHVEAIDATR
jgi:PIN domain nuclease of toxin-antitoxin system